MRIWKQISYFAHGVHSSGGHVAAGCCAADAASDQAPNCVLPGLTLSFYTWHTHTGLCLKALRQQQRHRNAVNMEGLSTFRGGAWSRNPFTSCFSYNTVGHRKDERLMIVGQTLALYYSLCAMLVCQQYHLFTDRYSLTYTVQVYRWQARNILIYGLY